MANKTRAARGLFSSHKETQEVTKNTKNVPDDSGQNVEPDYLKLLDWTGRQFQTDKRGVIPATCTPILDRLDCSEETVQLLDNLLADPAFIIRQINDKLLETHSDFHGE